MGCQDEIVIEPMTVKDLAAARSIEQRSFTTPWSYQAFLAELEQNDCAHYLVAKAAGTVVGYIGMWMVLDEGHITNIAVDPAWRGRGIGRRLLKTIMEKACQLGALRITLEVRKSNRAAQNLYLSLGYEMHGLRPNYYQDNGEAAIIMWKELSCDDTHRPDSGH